MSPCKCHDSFESLVNDLLDRRANVGEALSEIVNLYLGTYDPYFMATEAHVKRMEQFGEFFTAETANFCKNWVEVQGKTAKAKLLEDCVEDFVEGLLRKAADGHLCCHRDLCSVALWVDKELNNWNRSSLDPLWEDFVRWSLQLLRRQLQARVAANLLTDRLGYAPLVRKKTIEEEDEYEAALYESLW